MSAFGFAFGMLFLGHPFIALFIFTLIRQRHIRNDQRRNHGSH